MSGDIYDPFTTAVKGLSKKNVVKNVGMKSTVVISCKFRFFSLLIHSNCVANFGFFAFNPFKLFG